MKKRHLGLFGLGLGLALCGLFAVKPLATPVLAEGEEPTPVVVENSVVIEKAVHGSVTSDIEKGNVGDIVTLTVKHDLFYKISLVSVNGTALVEDEKISGKYTFALVEGENKVHSEFVIDQEICGELSDIIEEASNKDWKNLFSVKNVISIVSFLLSGGVLLAMVRYFIKDKRLEGKVESATKETISTLVPEQTKEAVTNAVKELVTPIFEQITADDIEIKKAMSVLAKCMALMQENTPEARRAVLDELSGLKIGDLNTIESVKKYIEDLIAQHEKTYQETMAKLNEISTSNKTVIEEKTKEKESVEKEEKPTYDGTTI